VSRPPVVREEAQLIAHFTSVHSVLLIQQSALPFLAFRTERTMRHLTSVSLAAFVWITAVQGGEAADPHGWKELKWGMSPKEARVGAAKSLDKKKVEFVRFTGPGNHRVVLSTPKDEWDSAAWVILGDKDKIPLGPVNIEDVKMWFDNGKLYSVELSLEGLETDYTKPIVKVHPATVELLRAFKERYGVELEEESAWYALRIGDTTIKILATSSGPLSIEYTDAAHERRVAEDKLKKSQTRADPSKL
jgi:hypothetical protein